MMRYDMRKDVITLEWDMISGGLRQGWLVCSHCWKEKHKIHTVLMGNDFGNDFFTKGYFQHQRVVKNLSDSKLVRLTSTWISARTASSPRLPWKSGCTSSLSRPQYRQPAQIVLSLIDNWDYRLLFWSCSITCILLNGFSPVQWLRGRTIADSVLIWRGPNLGFRVGRLDYAKYHAGELVLIVKS